MKQKTKSITITIILIILVINAILLINYIKANNNLDEKTAKCIAEKSKIIVSPTCGWCAKQKQDLGEYSDYFEFIDISQNPEILKQYNIKGTPSWIMDGVVYSGYQTVKELKQITGC